MNGRNEFYSLRQRLFRADLPSNYLYQTLLLRIQPALTHESQDHVCLASQKSMVSLRVWFKKFRQSALTFDSYGRDDEPRLYERTKYVERAR